MKLDNELHQASNIIMMKELPSFAKVYGILLQEQVHQDISKGAQTEIQESMACRVEKRKFY